MNHGTYRGAQQHWRAGEKTCEPCRVAASRVRKQNQLAILAGRPKTVDLGERAHRIVRTTPRNILTELTGFTHSQILRWDKGGPEARVLRTTRARILAAQPTWTPVGIQRRLQALSMLGWSMVMVSAECGVFHDGLKKLRKREDPKHVRLEVGNAIAAVYDDLSMRLPPEGQASAETRAKAVGRGWVPPLAWDEGDIDDPDARPRGAAKGKRKTDVDPVAVDRAMAGDRITLTRDERYEVVARLRNMGWSLRDIEDRTVITKSERYLVREAS